MKNRSISLLNWMEFKKLVPKKIDTVLLPVGTIEAHGVIALGTDNIIPERLSYMLCEKLNTLIAPTIPYGITRSLLPYPGSLTVSVESFKNYLLDTLFSLSETGFKKIVIINGHGGNTETLKEIGRELFLKKRVKNVIIDWWILCQEETKEVYDQTGAHAGIDENAMILAISPELVKKNLYKKDLASTFIPGVMATPFPTSIILYKEGEGHPDFDKEKASLLLEKVVKKLLKTILFIFKQWEKI